MSRDRVRNCTHWDQTRQWYLSPVLKRSSQSLSLAIIWILIACSVAVGELIAVFTVLTLIYAAFGALSLHVFNRVKYVNALMLPVAEGMVQV